MQQGDGSSNYPGEEVVVPIRHGPRGAVTDSGCRENTPTAVCKSPGTCVCMRLYGGCDGEREYQHNTGGMIATDRERRVVCGIATVVSREGGVCVGVVVILIERHTGRSPGSWVYIWVGPPTMTSARRRSVEEASRARSGFGDTTARTPLFSRLLATRGPHHYSFDHTFCSPPVAGCRVSIEAIVLRPTNYYLELDDLPFWIISQSCRSVVERPHNVFVFPGCSTGNYQRLEARLGRMFPLAIELILWARNSST